MPRRTSLGMPVSAGPCPGYGLPRLATTGDKYWEVRVEEATRRPDLCREVEEAIGAGRSVRRRGGGELGGAWWRLDWPTY